MNIDIHDDVCDEIVRCVLIDQILGVSDEIRTLKKQRKRLRREGTDLPEHRQIDLCDAKRNREAMMTVVRYYSTTSQWQEALEKLK